MCACVNELKSSVNKCLELKVDVGIQESPTLENREKEKQEKTKGEEN